MSGATPRVNVVHITDQRQLRRVLLGCHGPACPSQAHHHHLPGHGLLLHFRPGLAQHAGLCVCNSKYFRVIEMFFSQKYFSAIGFYQIRLSNFNIRMQSEQRTAFRVKL